MEDIERTQSAFKRLKVVCVPLLGNSLLTPASVPAVISLLAQLQDTLEQFKNTGHVYAPATISYVFFPLSSLLRRNDPASIPDRVMEKLLAILALLCDAWWWDMELVAWEQVFMLCGAVLGGIDRKGKGKERDEETKVAAATCLWSLLRKRTEQEDPSNDPSTNRAHRCYTSFRQHAQSPKFLPVMGQTLHSLMATAEYTHLSLQRITLKVLSSIIKDYLPDGFVPSVLPGTISSMSRIALGEKSSKGWANGDIVADSLLVMQLAIVRAIGNEICVQEGAIRRLDDLEDLTSFTNPDAHAANSALPPFSTSRTESWLRGTASQLHIALNALAPLVKHPTPSALIGLAIFSATVLSATSLTLPHSQSLLLSFLLSMKSSDFERVSFQAERSLREILSPPSNCRHELLHVLLQISGDYLAALPRLLLSHADTKVEHVAGVLESICHLAKPSNQHSSPGISAIATGVGKLLGPHGGVEKWGWSLLSTLEFFNPPIVVTSASAAQLMLESDVTEPHITPFPELALRHLHSRSAQVALGRMLRTLGQTAGEDCLFTVDWFMDVGRTGRGKRSVAAIWCVCRLLEGAGDVSLDLNPSTNNTLRRSKRVERFARDLARQIADNWDDGDDEDMADSESKVPPNEDNILVEHVQGLVTVQGIPGSSPSSSASSRTTAQPVLHRSLSLQLLAIISGILESRFSALFLHTLYPVLHGIVSGAAFVSASALAALTFITNSTSYATPANLLLSNFDYALDSVSRHLTRRWLDVDATKVLAVLVRLVGRDVVQKAGDVVEECFDRLDEFHGYELIVDGLVEVLGEVVKVIGEDDDNRLTRESRKTLQSPSVSEEARGLNGFAQWYTHRSNPLPQEEALRDETYPREAWGNRKEAEEVEDAEGAGPRTLGDDPFAEAPPTPTQALTTQIVSRSVYFLTHSSPTIRARILLLLANSVPVLPEPALLPSVHQAWPFILNRLADSETFVVSAAAALVEALATNVGDFMAGRVWEDVWPRFRTMLQRLARADASSALARRGFGVGTESAYTHSHRLYRAIILTMAAAVHNVQAQDAGCWEVVVLFRRFLRSDAHEELQATARMLYIALCKNNEDAVWLGLAATLGWVGGSVAFLREPKWDVETNARIILNSPAI